MDNPEKIAMGFLNELNSNKESFKILSKLIELLENKNDPEMTEIRLINHLYSFIENLSNLERNLKSYVNESKENLPGNKLTALYDNISYSGSIYRD